MCRPKYLVRPGYVTSQYDGQLHFVGAIALMRLYGVRPSECVVFDREQPLSATQGASFEHLIELRPRYNGDYRIPKPPIA